MSFRVIHYRYIKLGMETAKVGKRVPTQKLVLLR